MPDMALVSGVIYGVLSSACDDDGFERILPPIVYRREKTKEPAGITDTAVTAPVASSRACTLQIPEARIGTTQSSLRV